MVPIINEANLLLFLKSQVMGVSDVSFSQHQVSDT
jgi:hypothetical protein